MNPVVLLREQIDACRKGSDDLSLPGLADLAQAIEQDRDVAIELDRSQQFDRAVISALHDVPVPGDLLARLLDQVNKQDDANKQSSVDRAVAESAVALPETSLAPAVPPRFSRRWMLALAATAAVALLAVGVAPFLPRSGRNVAQNQLSESAVQWNQDISLTDGWSDYTAGTPPHLSLRNLPVRFRRYDTSHGPAVVYDLARPGGPRALLFVVTTPDKFAVNTLPFSTIATTGGLGIGAWQSGNVLYVLVIDRDRQQHLDQFVRVPREA